MSQTNTILVVDDFQSIRRVQESTLARYGFNTKEAENGKVALDILLAENDDIGLIISDYNMPVLDGMELLTEVKKHDKLKRLPFIMLTSEVNKEKMKEAKSAGLDAWITKPYKIDSFINRINFLMKNS